MESVVIYGALTAVIMLLAVAVYDTNPTLQKLSARALKKVVERKQSNEIPSESFEIKLEQEIEQETEMRSDFEQEPQPLPTEMWQELPDTDATLSGQTSHTKPEIEIKKQVRLILQASGDRITEKARSIFARGSSKKELLQLQQRRQEQQIILNAISAINGSINELSARLAEAEANSDDFKDSIWSLRYSIDEIEQRLNEQKSDDMEKTVSRVELVEEAIANLKTSTGSLPDQLNHTKKDINELGSRLRDIHTELRNTIGYGIHKSFECNSCGAEGYVASQVTCSKCGTESMWGWWPPKEETEEDFQNEAEMDHEAGKIMGVDQQEEETLSEEDRDSIQADSPQSTED